MIIIINEGLKINNQVLVFKLDIKYNNLIRFCTVSY